MWYLAYLIIVSSTGQAVFAVHQLPYYSQEECQQDAPDVLAPFTGQAEVFAAACVEIRDSEGI